MLNWLKNLWNKLLRAFKSFIKAAIPVVSQIVLSELKDFALNTVGTLQHSNLSNEEKRNKAFDDIRAEAERRGKNISDSLINVLIELSLQFIKNRIN